jgi:hypothetical protein
VTAANRRACAIAAAVACAAALVGSPSAAPPGVRVIRLRGHPFVGSVVAAYGSIWVASHVGLGVYRINPRTNRVVKSIRVGENQCVGPAVGAGAIWEPNCWGETGLGIVYQVSARKNRVVGHIRGEGAAFGDGSLWTISDDNSSLLRIDPHSKLVLARIPLPIKPPRYWLPAGVCYGSLWATVDTAVVRFNTATNKVEAVIPLPGSKSAFGASGGFFSADFVACTGGKVWVPNLAGLYAIDADANIATRVPVAIRPNSQLGDPGITAANGHVFVRTSDTTVDEVDPATGRIVHTYPATGGGGGQIAAAYGSLWVPNAASGTVWREPIR